MKRWLCLLCYDYYYYHYYYYYYTTTTTTTATTITTTTTTTTYYYYYYRYTTTITTTTTTTTIATTILCVHESLWSDMNIAAYTFINFFLQTLLLKLSNETRTTLIPGAIPSLNMPKRAFLLPGTWIRFSLMFFFF